MAKPTVFILDPYHAEAIKAIQETPWIEAVLKTDPRIANWRTEADGLMIRSDTRITASDLEQTTKLKVIVKQGVGVDNIDLDAAKKQNVAVCNTPALNSEAVAELTLCLAICIARRVVEIDRRIHQGETVVRSNVIGKSLFQKKVGVIGMGNIGKAVAEKWHGAMKGEVLAFDPYASADAWPDLVHQRCETLEELLAEADVVTLHVPLTSSTRNLIGKPEVEKMKDSAILLNCARGGIVDEVALLEALKARTIYGAALDAMNVEPPTLEIYKDLLSEGSLVMTPHIGGMTEENQVRSGMAVVETVLAVLQGHSVSNRVV